MLSDQLAILEAADLIRQAQPLPELEYLFRHSLVQEAAYQSLLKQNRRALHQTIGEAMERMEPSALSALAPILAHHFFEAEDMPRALNYFVQAGDQAARKFANAESLAHYTCALEAAQQADPDGETLLHIYIARGRALEMSGRYDEALANDRELEALALERGDRPMELAALLARSTIHSAPTARFDPPEAQSLSDRAMALANALGDRKAEAKILWNLVLLNRFVNRYDLAVEYGERSAALARELGLREQLAFTLNDMYPGYMAAGQVAQGRATLLEAQALWRELGNLPMLADSLTNMAEINWTIGVFRQAQAQAVEALRISKSVGNSWGQAYSSSIIGMVSTELGEFDKAFEYFERAQRLGREAGFVVPDIMCPTGIALCMASLGAPARGLPFAQAAVDAAERNMPSYRAFPLAILAWLFALTGDSAAALSAVQLARLEMKLSDPILSAFVGSAAGDASLRCGQVEQGLIDADAVLSTIEVFGLTGTAPDAWHLRARALTVLGRTDEAYEALKTSYAAAVQTGWRRDFWSIVGELAQMSADRGDTVAAQSYQVEAREAVAFLVANAPDAELRESFLALPAVRQILAGGIDSNRHQE